MVHQPANTSSALPRRVLAVAVALAPAAILAIAVLVLNPGAQLERGLASAAAVEARLLLARDTSGKAVQTVLASGTFEEGTEGFWLSHAPDAGNVRVTWKAPVAAGDRVIVNFGAYNREIVDVVSVEEDNPAATTRIDTGLGKPVRYVITGRRTTAANDLIRLTVDAEGRGLTTIVGMADRAL